jgi:uncharacterized protein (TIGR02421 family)
VERNEARELLERVSQTLEPMHAESNLLAGIGWPRDVETRFFAGGATELPDPTYEVDRAVFDRENADLARLAASIEGDEPIPTWLRAVVVGAIDRNRLLLARGTRDFGRLSLEIYGGARTSFYGLAATNAALADHVLARLQIHGWDEAKDRDARALSAEELREEFLRRSAKHRPHLPLEVVLDERCASKAIAGSTRVRIRADATFQPWEADGLYCHEVETHVFSAQNGAAQPLAPFLRAGGPRTTPTQEGLAVFSELYNHALATPRFERLAVRVKTVGMAEDGASFLDIYRFLVGRGYAQHDAFLDAARVFRGGLCEGGSVFTKDACYLAGLLHVYAFLAAFVRGGFRDEVELLMAGRIALEDLMALMELRSMGLLERPKHRPRWLERWSTLLPYFSFASFLEKEIDLSNVTAHYRAEVERASAARPPASRRALPERESSGPDLG